MRKFRAIVQTKIEPLDHEVIWAKDGLWYYWNDDRWEVFNNLSSYVIDLKKVPYVYGDDIKDAKTGIDTALNATIGRVIEVEGLADTDGIDVAFMNTVSDANKDLTAKLYKLLTEDGINLIYVKKAGQPSETSSCVIIPYKYPEGNVWVLVAYLGFKIYRGVCVTPIGDFNTLIPWQEFLPTLNGTTGTIDTKYLPSYVDDVLEYSTLTEFPETGESGKIYVALDTNYTYRWSGSEYILMSSSLDKNIIVKDVSNVNEIFTWAAKSEIAGSKDISIVKFRYPANDGTTYASGLMFLFRGVGGKVCQYFMYDYEVWIRGVTGADGTPGKATNAFPLERTMIQRASLSGTTLSLNTYDNLTVNTVDLSGLKSSLGVTAAETSISDLSSIVYSGYTISTSASKTIIDKSNSDSVTLTTTSKLNGNTISPTLSYTTNYQYSVVTTTGNNTATVAILPSTGVSYVLITTSANYLGVTKSTKTTVYIRSKSYYGTAPGYIVSDVLSGFKTMLVTSANGTYTFTLEEDGYIYFVIPSDVTFNYNGVKSAGFEVPMTLLDNMSIKVNEIMGITETYCVYRTTNKLVAGSYTLTVS